MSCTTEDLMRKEVINTCTAHSMGCITSFAVDISCGKIQGFFVSSGRGFFSFGSDCDTFIPWDKIVRIGEDVILVDVPSDHKDKDDCDCEWKNSPKKKHFRFF